MRTEANVTASSRSELADLALGFSLQPLCQTHVMLLCQMLNLWMLKRKKDILRILQQPFGFKFSISSFLLLTSRTSLSRGLVSSLLQSFNSNSQSCTLNMYTFLRPAGLSYFYLFQPGSSLPCLANASKAQSLRQYWSHNISIASRFDEAFHMYLCWRTPPTLPLCIHQWTHSICRHVSKYRTI